MLTCDGYENNTLATTQQTFACTGICETQKDVLDTDFYLVVIDALNRLGVALGTAGALVANITPEEMEEAEGFARCVTEGRGLADTDPVKAKAMILAQLNELICGN